MRTLPLPNLEEKNIVFNSMNFNLIYEFESNPILFSWNLRISIQFKLHAMLFNIFIQMKLNFFKINSFFSSFPYHWYCGIAQNPSLIYASEEIEVPNKTNYAIDASQNCYFHLIIERIMNMVYICNVCIVKSYRNIIINVIWQTQKAWERGYRFFF